MQSQIWQTTSSYIIWWKYSVCAFPHLLGSPSSYITLHPIASEFPYRWGKFCFLFYQCGNGPIYLPQPKPTYLPNRGGIYFPQFFSIYPKQIRVFTIYSIIPFNTYYPYKHSVCRRWNRRNRTIWNCIGLLTLTTNCIVHLKFLYIYVQYLYNVHSQYNNVMYVHIYTYTHPLAKLKPFSRPLVNKTLYSIYIKCKH